MKRLVIIILLFIISFYFYINMADARAEMQKSISEKLIRFHILANSNEEYDQNLKIAIKDEVINYLSGFMENVESVEGARQILIQEEENLDHIARRTIEEWGYDYDVKIYLKEESFPLKSYGTISLPPGKYNALKIVIGEGRGDNWWCVMFPPLCFIDLTLGNIAITTSEDRMSKFLSEDEFAFVLGDDSKIKFRFKIFEFFQAFKHKEDRLNGGVNGFSKI